MVGKGILPKWKAPGVDFCGSGDYHYIIRSDLGCYMQAKDLYKGCDLTIHSLHPACQGGDHYIARDGYFFIIKGKSCRQVTNMSTDSDMKVYPLPPENQGGDHYLFIAGLCHIMNQSKEAIDVLASLTSAMRVMTAPWLQSRRGLYYWSLHDRLYFVTYDDIWGLHFNYSETLNFNKVEKTFLIHPDVINFLPGGLSLTHGPAYGVWENITPISSDTGSHTEVTKRITRKVGYEKLKMSKLENNWKVSPCTGLEPGALTAASVRYQFSLSAEYGGAGANTDNETWTEATEREETVTVPPKLHKRLYVWQYKLKLGQEDVLHCRDMKLDDVSTPPTGTPPPATTQRLCSLMCTGSQNVP